MKIEYGSETLGDDANGDFINLTGRDHKRAVQTEPLFRAVAESTIARGNLRNGFSFTIDKEHATLAAALAYVIGFPDTLPGQDELRFTEGTEAWSMADAALTGLELVSLTGRSTTFRFTFTGGLNTQSA